MSQPIHALLDEQARARPNAPALSDSLGNIWSYSDLARASAALADKLSDLGVRRNDRVLAVVENCAPAVAAIFASSRVGAAVVPVNARQTAPEIDRIIAHAGPAMLLFSDKVSPEASAHAARFDAEPVLEGLSGKALLSSPDDSLSDVATLLYTTGTTGPPKGVMLTHDNLIFGGGATCTTRNVTPADVLYGVLPISHVFGLTSIVMAAVIAGASVRLAPRFSPAKLYEALTSGVTLLSAVPQMHAQLMHYTRGQGHTRLPATTLRYVSSGAAPLDIDWKRRAEAFFGIPLQNGYGMTETTAGVCLTSHTESNDDISVGTPFPGVSVKLDKAAAGAEGDVGEVLVGGGGIMKGYFRNPAETAKALDAEGWLHSGDLGRYDAAGNLHISGRAKELIIHGGFNVYPPEVEAALNDHPQVIQCAVIGVKRDGDELVVAFVEVSADDAPDIDTLRSFAAERLAGYKRPSQIVLTEKLPAAPTGKILKSKLKDLL
ncbi:acyl--CoA ligase [Lentibacter algarum]|uniref:class I adenylate-forming enzyme family protein n=1 Tax=Lentibacter algarum TaxID=576131 RepID=UPI001C09A5F9|nr:class I adenylate-forming enzyme family protein [Lentibacter algarum]MBU2983365.1 acyl--CoA ligase [Lentibacter algarum]